MTTLNSAHSMASMATTYTMKEKVAASEYTKTVRRDLIVSLVAFFVITVNGFGVSAATFAYVSNNYSGSFWAYFLYFIVIFIFALGIFKTIAGGSWIVFGLVVLTFAMAANVCGVVIDGFFAWATYDTDFDRCGYDAFRENQCTIQDLKCPLIVPRGSCFCCYIYSDLGCLQSQGFDKPVYYEGVEKCYDVEHHYNRLQLTSFSFQVFSFITAMVLWVYAFKYCRVVRNEGYTLKPYAIPNTSVFGGSVATLTNNGTNNRASTVEYTNPNAYSPPQQPYGTAQNMFAPAPRSVYSDY